MRRLLATVLLLTSAAAHSATALMSGGIVEVERTLADPTDLWVATTDLKRVNGFELNPEGACLDAICVPVKQDRDSNIFVKRSGNAWLNVTELASRIQQPYVVDHEDDIWSFGAIPAQRQSFVRDAQAPDFTLTDWQGNERSLSDFKGKKVMLLSWASW